MGVMLAVHPHRDVSNLQLNLDEKLNFDESIESKSSKYNKVIDYNKKFFNNISPWSVITNLHIFY